MLATFRDGGVDWRQPQNGDKVMLLRNEGVSTRMKVGQARVA